MRAEIVILCRRLTAAHFVNPLSTLKTTVDQNSLYKHKAIWCQNRLALACANGQDSPGIDLWRPVTPVSRMEPILSRNCAGLHTFIIDAIT